MASEADGRYYPVLIKESKELWRRYADLAKEYNIVLVGRVGEFKYYNMSEAVEHSLQVFNEITK